MKRLLLFCFLLLLLPSVAQSQEEHTEARIWNEILLESIRNDRARPVVHARNLFHLSAGHYDLWSVITSNGQPYFLGNEINGIDFEFDASQLPQYNLSTDEAVARAIRVYSGILLKHRFQRSPGRFRVNALVNRELGDVLAFIEFEPDYTLNDPANLAAYLAEKVIEFGLQDGSNEERDYLNRRYEPVNEPLSSASSDPVVIADPDRWQPLQFEEFFIDQSGINANTSVPAFLGAEWGEVVPFALKGEDLKVYQKPGEVGNWYVYHDPGPPPSFFDYTDDVTESSFYRWNFGLVANWSRHLTTDDGVVWDISPASIGNIGIENYPTTEEEYRNFYDEFEGGEISPGHALNPVTGQPYPPNLVKRGDYARILAEFWADGPDSETPPGHWFEILNKTMDHPLFERKFKGEGAELDPLEYDIKIYFTLGGAMHDAAITAWSIKGYYDYIRPISALRYLCQLGQRSDRGQSLFNIAGIELANGHIRVQERQNADDLILINTWEGFQWEDGNQNGVAGVDWERASRWVPYQRSSFVTPNFAGYISGHSTFSSAAAQVLEVFTGDPYFPGGVGEFFAPADTFLQFEAGPSEDVVLQWATYRDASDQTSLSRIWGGIHPPIDDIPGRKIGIDVGNDAFDLADRLFSGGELCPMPSDISSLIAFPTAVSRGIPVRIEFECGQFESKTVDVYNQLGQLVATNTFVGGAGSFNTVSWGVGSYYARIRGGNPKEVTVITVH